MRALTIFGVATLAVALSSCTTMGEDLPPMNDMLSEATGQNGRACVDTRDIQSYGVLEEDIISINAAGSYYLATTQPNCMDIMGSLGAAFSSDFRELCGQSMDTILTSGGSCTIGQLYQFETREEAFDTYNSIMERREELKNSDS